MKRFSGSSISPHLCKSKDRVSDKPQSSLVQLDNAPKDEIRVAHKVLQEGKGERRRSCVSENAAR